MNHWINLFDGFIKINEKDSNTESANHNLEINESIRHHESLDKPFQWPPVNRISGRIQKRSHIFTKSGCPKRLMKWLAVQNQ